MDQLLNLCFIINFGVGYDVIDIVGVDVCGIWVMNMFNVLNDDVVDLVVVMLILENCRMLVVEIWMCVGEWVKGLEYFLQCKMLGCKVGIFGFGCIGCEIVDWLVVFRMQIYYFLCSDKQVVGWIWYDDFVVLVYVVDDLVIVVVGGLDIIGIVLVKVIKVLGLDGIIVNIVCGLVIDEMVLLDVLEVGWLCGVVLDVFLNELCFDLWFFVLKNVMFLLYVGLVMQEICCVMGELQW